MLTTTPLFMPTHGLPPCAHREWEGRHAGQHEAKGQKLQTPCPSIHPSSTSEWVHKESCISCLASKTSRQPKGAVSCHTRAHGRHASARALGPRGGGGGGMRLGFRALNEAHFAGDVATPVYQGGRAHWQGAERHCGTNCALMEGAQGPGCIP